MEGVLPHSLQRQLCTAFLYIQHCSHNWLSCWVGCLLSLLGTGQLMTSEFRKSERATLQVVAEVSLLKAWLLQQHPSALHDPPSQTEGLSDTSSKPHQS